MHVVGAGTMGGDIAAWCALRGLTVTLQDQNAERLAPAMGRAAKLFADRLRDPRRVRDATDRLIPDVAGDGIARADVIIEAIFENVDAKRSLFAAVEAKAKPSAILATNTSSIPLEDIATAMADPTRLVGLHFFNPVAKMMLVEIVVGAADAARADRARGRVRPPDRRAAAAGEERARLPRQPRARAVPDGGDALRRRRHRAGDGRRGGARVRHADGADRARRHGGSRHLRRGRQDARAGRAAAAQGWRSSSPPDTSAARRSAASTTTRPASPPKGRPAPFPPGLADRLIGPFVAEAKAALAEGIVADADLVDAGAIFGTGFAPFRGGPLHYAGHPRADGVAAGATSAAPFWCSIAAERRQRPPGRTGMRHPADRRRQSPQDARVARRILGGGNSWKRSGSSTIRRACPPKSTSTNTRRSATCSRRASAEFADRAAPSPAWASRSPSPSSTRCRAAFGAYLQANGCTKGTRVALMMPNILQYPVCLFGIAARRLHGGERQSAVHGARARAPAHRLRRRGDRRRRELRAHRAGSGRPDQGAAR